MIDIISRPEQVTARWVTQALAEAGCLPDGRVDSVSARIIGTGKMGDNARFTLSYSGEHSRAPATLVGKFPATDETARAMAGAQGAYYAEVMFYRDLAGKTSMRTPRIYANEISEDRVDFVTLMEDMAPAKPGSQLQGESLAHARQAMQEAAKLAAAFYGDESIGQLDYVMTAARDDGGEFGEALLKQYWPSFKERFAENISSDGLAFGDQYVQNHSRFVSRYKGPKTLVHGDFRGENILFGEQEICTVDWQTLSESSPLTDLAYFMGGSVEVENRRDWERELVQEYCEQLALHGVQMSDGECWSQYREQAMHGLMITILGACFSAPGERSDAMFLAMIQRHLQHCIDLNATEFLG